MSNSNATGGIFVFLFISEDNDTVVDFTRSQYVCLERTTSFRDRVRPLQLPVGEYAVSAYDIEEDGQINIGQVNPADTVTYSQDENIQSMFHFSLH